MKKIICIIISALLVSTMFTSCKSVGAKKDGNTDKSTSQTEESGKSQGTNSSENSSENSAEGSSDSKKDADSSEGKYKSKDDLADEFMKICADGDTEKMYQLYYDDIMGKTYDRIKDQVSKEDFDKLLSDEMKSLTRNEVIAYGSEELPNTVSPLYYVDYLYYSTTGGESTGLTDEQCTDCAVLRVYKEDSTYSDHMMACIDGAWYLTV